MEYMFRIVEKKSGEVLYFQSICNANKAMMVQRCKKFLECNTFKNKTADKDYCVEFSYFDWQNYWKHNENYGYSEYTRGWRCTTIVGLKYKEDGKHLEYGNHLYGRKLDFSSKPKGGAWGAMMIDMGMV